MYTCIIFIQITIAHCTSIQADPPPPEPKRRKSESRRSHNDTCRNQRYRKSFIIGCMLRNHLFKNASYSIQRCKYCPSAFLKGLKL